MRVNLQQAYVLHTRNYTDSRLLVELFTPEYGRVGCVARTSKSAGRFSLLRPFQPLLVSWQGKSDLKTLVHSEIAVPAHAITGGRLYCGMYLNELVLRLLAGADPHSELFYGYRDALVQLAGGGPIEPVLRSFEFNLLDSLGYGIPFDVDTESGEAISPEGEYTFVPMNGFTRAPALPREKGADKSVFAGAVVLALGSREFDEPGVLSAAKHLSRQALRPLLGDKPLKSRELFNR